jgi:hypothetical protein
LNFRGLNNVYDAPADSSTGELWWSYLIKPGAYTGIPFAGLSFYTDAISGVAAADTDFATATRDSSGLKYGFSDLDVTTNFFTTTVVPTNGVTTLIVGRLVMDGGTNTTADNQDRIDLYVNPTIGGGTPASSNGNASVTANFQTIRLASQNGAPFTVDEFRFGESFADVTPMIQPNTDFNGINGTDLADFTILKDHFLNTGATHADGDANFDTIVNHQDFFLWRTAYLAGGGSSADFSWEPVPEPATLLLMACTAFGAIGFARPPRQLRK